MLTGGAHRRFGLVLVVSGAAAACGSETTEGPDDPVPDAGLLPDGAPAPPRDGSTFDSSVAGNDGSTNGDGDSRLDATSAADASTDAFADAQLNDAGSDATSDAGTDGASDAGDAAPPDDPDLPVTAFPQTTPLLFGYTLADAFPGTFLSGAMDMEWPIGSAEPFVLQRGGHIVRLQGNGNRTLVLDFETAVAARGEGGALGMALHPKFADAVAPKPYVYVWYNAEGNPTRQRLSRFTWSTASKVFDRASELIMVSQTEQTTEHNGAHIRFGPDGFLYFGNGDDTRPDATTQRLNDGLFSGIFRIDVDSAGGAVSHAPPRQPANGTTQGYFIPNDNPFVGVANASEEYFALGFRNPYAFNFDRATGALWQGDVGDTWREEINLVTSGGNYGWPLFEGSVRRRAGNTTIGVPKAPVYDYPHWQLGDLSSIMAGYVYRGATMPELAGRLIYSDWPTGRIWALDTQAATRSSLLEANHQNAPVGFAQDNSGEVYLIGWSRILKLVRDAAPSLPPAKLSDTHLFRNLNTMRPASTLIAYSIRSPLWSDGASKQRWVHVPANQPATMTADGTVMLPKGAVLVKQFDLPNDAQPVGRSKRLETRVLVVGQSATYGFTYRWNALGTDADLVTEAVHETIDDAVPAKARSWHFPSSGECWSCHREANRVLGFRGEQLNFTLPGGTNQITALAAKGIFAPQAAGVAPAPLADPADVNATIEARATAYLAANCSSCHRPGNSFLGGVTWNAMPGVLPANRGLIAAVHNNAPMAAGLGLPNGRLVTKGNADASILIGRIRSTDRDLSMPPLGRTQVDPLGNAVLTAWVQSL